MRFRRRGLALGAIAVASALTVAACSSSGGSGGGGGGSTGGTYSVGLSQVDTFTPVTCYDSYCNTMLQAVFTGLYKFATNADGTVSPVLTEQAKSVETTDNGKTWKIEINPGFTFTNGEAVTAQSFVDTWNYAANGGNGSVLGFVFGPSQLNVVGYDTVEGTDSKDGKMAGLKVVNDTTIQVTLVKPVNKDLFANYLAGPQIAPMPSAGLKDITAFNKQPIGNGPYKLTGPWTTSEFNVTKNPDYKGTPGNADNINFKMYEDDKAQWNDLQANTLDVVPFLPTNALSTASSVLGDRFLNMPGGWSMSYYAFPTESPQFKSQDVRVAIAKSINFAEINEKLYYGTRQVATSYAPSTVAGGGQDVCGDKCVFNAEAAKALLKKAGGIPGNEVQISQQSASDGSVEKAICNQIQTNLGVTCTPKIFQSFGAMVKYMQSLSGSDPALLVGSGWGADNATLPSMFAVNFLTGDPNNWSGYSNPEFDRLIAEGNAELDSAAQIKKWQEAEAVLFKDFQAWPIQARNIVSGWSTNVSNVDINTLQLLDVSAVTVNG